MFPSLHKVFALIALLLGSSSIAQAQWTRDSLAAATPAQLIQVLSANADISGDVVLGIAARERLSRIGNTDPAAVVPLVVAAIEAARSPALPQVSKRVALIGVLSDIGAGAEAAVSLLDAILKDPNERNEFVRLQAGLALANIGTPAAQAAAKASSRADAERSVMGVDDVGARHAAEEHAYFIRQQLRAPMPAEAVIQASLDVLAAGGPRMAAAAPTLARAQADVRLSAAIRARIAEVLTKMGRAGIQAPPPQDLVEEVIADTRSPDQLVNRLAMQELGRLGPSPRAVEALIDALKAGRNPGAAALELGNFGPLAQKALPELIPYFTDARAAANAIQAAGKLGRGDAPTIAALRRVAGNPDSAHRALAVAALEDLGATEALPEISAAFSDPRAHTRVLAARALGGFGGDAVPTLSAGLADPDSSVRIAVADALARIGPAASPAVPGLARQLDSGETRLREAAARALAAIGGPDAQAALGADAARFADADRHRYAGLRQGEPRRVADFLRELPIERKKELALEIATDPDPALAELGSWTVEATGGDATPYFARLVAKALDGFRVGAFLGGSRIVDGP